MKTTPVLALAALLPALAFAQDPKTEAAKVSVKAEVVLASVEGNEIDPPALKAMQQAFEKKVKYGYLKRVLEQTVQVESKQPTMVKLPNGKDASLQLEKLEADVATLRVKLHPADATYKLGQKGSLYFQGGKHDGKDVWLVLSPAK